MKELFRERDFTRIGYFNTILENAGIETTIKNKHISATHVDIPEFWPALCVVHDEDFPVALEVLRKLREENEAVLDQEIECPHCKQINPGNFEVCWACEEPLLEKTEPE